MAPRHIIKFCDLDIVLWFALRSGPVQIPGAVGLTADRFIGMQQRAYTEQATVDRLNADLEAQKEQLDAQCRISQQQTDLQQRQRDLERRAQNAREIYSRTPSRRPTSRGSTTCSTRRRRTW